MDVSIKFSSLCYCFSSVQNNRLFNYLYSLIWYLIQKRGGDAGPVDLDQTTVTFEPDESVGGGLHVPGKDGVVFRPPQRKSLLGILQDWDVSLLGSLPSNFFTEILKKK